MNKTILGITFLMMLTFITEPITGNYFAKAADTEKTKSGKFSGVIEKVDPATKSMEVKGKIRKNERTVTIVIGNETKVMKADKEIPLAEIKKGMQVSIEYKREGEKIVVTSILVGEPKEGKKE